MSRRDSFYDEVDDIELPQKRNSKKRSRKKKKKMRKFIFFIIIEIIVLLLLLGAWYIKSKLDKKQTYNLDNEKLKITPLDLDDYENILVFGVDARDDALKSGTRSDTMMLVSIDKKNGEIKLTSFYRDTYVYMEYDGQTKYDKLGHAYSYGGPELALATINDNFDLDISQFVTVNFTSVANAINLLGGVEIDVSEKEVDSVNKYGREVAKVSGKEYTPISGAGKQLLDGYQAVGYSRIRKIDSDFVRTNRQRTVVNAMFEKTKQSDFSTINKMLDELMPQVLTNLSNGDIVSLVKKVMSYDITQGDGFPYNPTIKTVNKASCVLPTDLYQDVIELHEKVFDMEDYKPTDDVVTYSDHIKSVIAQ